MLWTKIASFLVVILVLSLVIAPAQAEKRVALVIGNGGYEHVTRLPNPPNDAADVASTLQRLGFTVQQMNDVGRNALRDALAEFSNAAMGADIAVVYYAGHGLEMDRQNYLIPVDAKLETDLRVRFEAVPLDDVLGALDGVKGIRIVMLDACRNNPFLASMKITTANRAISRGLSRVEPSVGTLVSFSAKEGTEAADGTARHSPYTTALLANLDRPGVEINKLFRLVRDDVLAATSGAQEPYTYGSTSGRDLFFKPPLEGALSSASENNSSKTNGGTTEGSGTYPAPVAPELQPPAASAQEEWDAVKTSGSEAVLKAFIEKHSGDKLYRALAEERLAALKSQQTQLPDPALPEEKPKKQDKKAAKLAPITKTKPVAKAAPATKPSQGGRPNATEYSRSIRMSGGFGGRAIKQTKYGLLECSLESSGRRCWWK